MGTHINSQGRFQSDKYPTTPAGKVPLSTSDRSAQDLLWEYAQRHRPVDGEFSEDLELALLKDGFRPGLKPKADMPPGCVLVLMTGLMVILIGWGASLYVQAVYR